MVAFVAALEMKATHSGSIRQKNWNGVQLALMALGSLSALVLLAGVYQGLLGEPDMMVRGNDSVAGRLVWYQDKTALVGGLSPGLSAGALLAPLWIWRAMMLAWALWIAAAVAQRLPAMWSALCLGGLWRKIAPKIIMAESAKNRSDDQDGKQGSSNAESEERLSDADANARSVEGAESAMEPKKK